MWKFIIKQSENTCIGNNQDRFKPSLTQIQPRLFFWTCLLFLLSQQKQLILKTSETEVSQETVHMHYCKALAARVRSA